MSAALARRRRAPPTSAGSIPRRSRACASEAWPEAAQRRRAARCAGLARLPHRGRGRRRTGWTRLARASSRARDARGAARRRRRRRCGSPPSACRSSAALWPERDARAGDRSARRATPSATGRATRRWSRSCAAGWKAWARSRRRRSRRRSACAPATIDGALAALEAEGFAMRGRFTPGADERRMVRAPPAGAHPSLHDQAPARARSSRSRARDFLRFLFDWQRVAPDARMEGPDALDGRARRSSKASRRRPAPGRARSCRRASPTTSRAGSTTSASPGRVAWTRLRPRNGRERRRRPRGAGAHDADRAAAAPPRRRCGRSLPPSATTTPQLELARAGASPTSSASTAPRSSTSSSSGTRPAALAGRGGAGRAGRARPRHLRQLRRPARAAGAVGERRELGAGGRRRARSFGMEDAGRWALRAARRPRRQRRADAEAVEHVARTLLRRYGVVFWRLLEREAAWLPPWRDLLRVYRRLEARGEIRGGRFVAGFSGEQFALPEAVGTLREVAAQAAIGRAGSSLSGADPLNLVGILTPGPRLAALTGNRAALPRRRADRDAGGGEVQFLDDVDPATEWRRARRCCAARPSPPKSEPEEPGTIGCCREEGRNDRPCSARSDTFRTYTDLILRALTSLRRTIIYAPARLVAGCKGFSRSRDAPHLVTALHPETIPQKKSRPSRARRTGQKPPYIRVPERHGRRPKGLYFQ